MITIPVNTAKSYDIKINKGELENIGQYVLSVHKPCNAVIITDDIVARLYLETVSDSLKKSGYNTFTFIIENGEQNKTTTTYINAINYLANNKLHRDDLVIALGGGVVGDIAGFVASTYMRGIDFIQVPTTLLSGIDASIGGKTGVDLDCGKNLVGTFHQPKLVFFDVETLKTLPDIQYKNGLGEGIKYAVLMGGELFQIMEQGINYNNILRFIELCVTYKKTIVEQDEKEGGIRRLLNLGHTLGHAIEQLSNFTVPHGLAVVKGIAKIAEASYKSNKLSKTEFDKIINLINKYGFDITTNCDIDQLLNVVSLDKKMGSDNLINVIDILGIGSCSTAKCTLKQLKEYLK